MKHLPRHNNLLFLFLFYSFASFAQNKKIDSLQGLLPHLKDDTIKANTLCELGLEFLYVQDTSKAFSFVRQSLALSIKNGFKKVEARCYLLIAVIHSSVFGFMSNPDEVNKITDTINKALTIATQIGDKNRMAYCYYQKGQIYYQRGNYPDAQKNYYSALMYYNKLGDKEMSGWTLHALGGSAEFLNNPKEALQDYFDLMKIAKEIDNRELLLSSYWGIVDTKMLGSSIQEELDALKYNTILQGMLKNNDTSAITGLYNHFGQIYMIIGAMKEKEKPKEAYQYYVKANEYYLKKLKMEPSDWIAAKGFDYELLGEVNMFLHHFPVADEYLQKSVAIGIKNGGVQNLEYVYNDIVALDSAEGNYKKAFTDLRTKNNYRDSIYNDETNKKSIESKLQYEYDKKEVSAKLEQQKKEEEQKRLRNLQYFAISFLGFLVIVGILIAFIQWRSNKHKKKANLLLEREKYKVENTLTELKATQEQLIQSEKMASLGELTAGIAHEIQNPLNFVNNFSEVNKEMIGELQTELKSGNINEAITISNDIKENEEKINHHGKRADAIVKGMLQHSRSSTGVKVPTNINALCDEYLKLAFHGIRTKDNSFSSTIETDFDSNIGKINIIPQDIGRVLLNLYNNAFYAMNEKLKAERSKLNADYNPFISVQTKKSGNHISITVSDNGNGISKNIVNKIFQPFFTTKPTGQGTGLGLSLSYDIIKAHGGDIKVETKEAEGTEFIIQLPVV